jgi:hypothetical protein
LFFCRNVKKIPNFGALRIARKSSDALLAANMRVLKGYPQPSDNETLREKKQRLNFLSWFFEK